jgi:dTDP-4-amino-4,6-dideoxygalactose transaminase
LEVTVKCSEQLLRLPLWHGIEDQQPRVIEALIDFFG